ncbi:MAG: ABC transporter ATP-binding protein [Chloroflexi bacterium]|jgi:ATP-binding cassette subfamily B multidrug efflux pump|nr:ABC transporter ATP-binding protein [Chloroflexota bacterium]
MRYTLRVFRYLRAYRGRIIQTMAFLVITTLLGLAPPRLIQGMVDTATRLGSRSVVALFGIGLLCIAIVSALFAAAQRYSMATIVHGLIYDIRNALYEQILHLPFGFHDQTPTGYLISRMTSDMEALSMFFGFGLGNIVGMVITFLGALIMLVAMSWQLALVALATVPFLAMTTLRSSNLLGPQFLGLRRQFARVTAQLQENFAGVRVVKAFAREQHEVIKFDRQLDDFMVRRLKLARVFMIYMPSMGFLTNLGMVLMLTYGGYAVITGSMSLGQLVASQGYMMMLTGPIRMIGWMVINAQRAEAAAEHLAEVLEHERLIADRLDAIDLGEVRGEIRFENVSFGYEEGAYVLHNCSLEVKPNETLAVMGATGSGKTSVINLIPRFYDVNEGRVLIDGHDVRDIKLASLRQHVGTIFQEAVLFSGTIAENIAYGRPDATQEEIERAAKMAQAHEFITRFPNGYQTHVGERGMTLSGGQRQRMTIARAMLLDPRILIMDDSTSSVDVETEYLIQQAMLEGMRGRTSVVIAHRLSTVKNADRIIVLDKGVIAEEGTHEELLALGGHYRQIYDTQLADQEEAG